MNEERVFRTGVVRDTDLDERGLRDGRLQPFVFRDIVWIEVLTECSEEARARLEGEGRIPAERTPSGNLIRGYE